MCAPDLAWGTIESISRYNIVCRYLYECVSKYKKHVPVAQLLPAKEASKMRMTPTTAATSAAQANKNSLLRTVIN